MRNKSKLAQTHRWRIPGPAIAAMVAAMAAPLAARPTRGVA